ncbi:MAG: YceI family protein [Gaiellaceae bacterium]
MSTTEIEIAIAPAGTWTLDPVHSTVGFEVAYLVGTFKGQFRDVDGQLRVDDNRATLEGSARVASVDVKDENLAAHLQSPDFFDAESHPELRFSADGIAVDGGTVTAEGEITIRGVTKPVVLAGTFAEPLTDAYGNERVGMAVSATVDRTEFGVSWNTPLPGGKPALANEVRIVGELAFVKA